MSENNEGNRRWCPYCRNYSHGNQPCPRPPPAIPNSRTDGISMFHHIPRGNMRLHNQYTVPHFNNFERPLTNDRDTPRLSCPRHPHRRNLRCHYQRLQLEEYMQRPPPAEPMPYTTPRPYNMRYRYSNSPYHSMMRPGDIRPLEPRNPNPNHANMIHDAPRYAPPRRLGNVVPRFPRGRTSALQFDEDQQRIQIATARLSLNDITPAEQHIRQIAQRPDFAVAGPSHAYIRPQAREVTRTISSTITSIPERAPTQVEDIKPTMEVEMTEDEGVRIINYPLSNDYQPREDDDQIVNIKKENDEDESGN